MYADENMVLVGDQNKNRSKIEQQLVFYAVFE